MFPTANGTAVAPPQLVCAAGSNGLRHGFSFATIDLKVFHVNQAPQVHILSEYPLNASIERSLSMEGLSVSDLDNEDVVGTTSFGFPLKAWVTVTVYPKYGRVTLRNTNHLSMLFGRGVLDSRVSFRAPIAQINTALASLEYICRVQDGCVPGVRDAVTVSVNDEGFFGKGGPLSASREVLVNVAQ
jgi:hypothetical protein